MKSLTRSLAAILVCATAFALGVSANQQTTPETNFASETIDIGMVVSDIDKSVKFYKDALGFEEVPGFKVPGQFALDTGLSNKLELDIKVLVLGKGEKEPGQAGLRHHCHTPGSHNRSAHTVTRRVDREPADGAIRRNTSRRTGRSRGRAAACRHRWESRRRRCRRSLDRSPATAP